MGPHYSGINHHEVLPAALGILSQIPALAQRVKRLWTLFQLPYPGGRSFVRRCAAVLTKVRLSLAVTPTQPGRPGKKLSTCQCCSTGNSYIPPFHHTLQSFLYLLVLCFCPTTTTGFRPIVSPSITHQLGALLANPGLLGACLRISFQRRIASCSCTSVSYMWNIVIIPLIETIIV